MSNHYLAVDLGASSGRLMLGWLEGGIIKLEEVHRFKNACESRNGCLVWNAKRLFAEIVAGLKRVGDSGRRPRSLGLDTWGVDYALLDAGDNLLGEVASYRDPRNKPMMASVYERISEEELYSRSGIQPLEFNTIFQLEAVRKLQPELLAKAKTFLMLPCYLNFLLTGQKKNEYTISSTSQLLDAEKGDWDAELLRRLDFPGDIFPRPELPGTPVGRLLPEIREAVGYDLQVVLPPAHDTASAVLAMPSADGDSAYLSSGTWSLMGVEAARPDCRWECRLAGFTNEGGYGRQYRFLKNIMGMWVIQRLHQEMAPHLDFAGIVEMARAGMTFTGHIDLSGPVFLMPDSMRGAIREACRRDLGLAPASDAEVMACAYRSLAHTYGVTVRDIERLTGRGISRIHIMGGGSNDNYLNKLTAEATGKEVFAGPVEATAIGNLLSQMLTDGVFANVHEARQAVAKSFAVTKLV